MALMGTQIFEHFIAYRYLKAEKLRLSVLFAALLILLSFGVTLSLLFGLNGSPNLKTGALALGRPNWLLMGAAAGQTLLLLFASRFVKRKLLYILTFIILTALPLLLFVVTLKTQPLFLPRVAFYLRYLFMGELVLGALVLLFGAILLFFNVYSTTSIFSVFLGTTTMVVVLSVLGGLEGEQKHQILGFSPHIVISLKKEGHIENFTTYSRTIKALLKNRGITATMAPYMEEEVLLKSASFEATQGILLRGIDPASPTFDLEHHMKSGTIENLVHTERIKWVDPAITTTVLVNSADPVSFLPPWPVDAPGIILSQEQAKTLGVSIGKEIDIISPRGTMSPTGPIPKMLRFRVAGIYSTKHFKYDLRYAFVNLEMAQTFSRKKNAISGWELRLKDKGRIDSTASLLESKLPDTFKIGTWKTRNRALFNAMKLEKFVMFIILVVIILVAAFSILANLIMVVMDKQQEIAILKSQGAEDSSIRRIFMLQGVMVGIIGLVLGLIAGLGLCIYLAVVGIKTSENIFVLARIPVSVSPLDIAAIAGSAVVLSILATLYPSWKATRVSPVQGLNKHE